MWSVNDGFFINNIFLKKKSINKNPETRRDAGFPIIHHWRTTRYELEIGQKNLQDLQVQNPFLLNIKFYKVKS